MKKLICIGLVCLSLTGVFFFLHLQTTSTPENTTVFHGNPTPSDELTKRSLRISVVNNYTGGWTHIPLNNGYYTGLDLLNLSSVTIEINEKTLPLEEALQGGYITIDEIIARARLDASQGVCNEVAKSKNGLTRFYYHYSDFSIWYVYDIYETPDGKAHLIKVVRLYGALSSPGTIDLWDSDGNPIDYEDWGLTFTIVQQDAEGLTLRCTQSGGQQLGQLKVGISWLEAKKGDPNAPSVNTLVDGAIPVPSIDLTMDGETELRCNLAETYDSLPAGEYTLVMQIEDQYDPKSITPMVRKFHDKQYYSIDFFLS